MTRLRLYAPYALIAGLAVWCLAALRADFAQIPLRVLASSGDALLAVAALSLVNYMLRIVRWRGYLTRLGYRFALRETAAIYLSGFAFTLGPAKLGELARARYYSPLGVPFPAVAGAFLVERLVDLLAMAALASLAISDFTRVRTLLWIATALIVIVLLVLAFWSRTVGGRSAGRRFPMPARVTTMLAGIDKTLSHAGELLRPRVLAAGFVLSLAAWGAEGAGLGILLSLFPGVRPDFPLAAGIYATAVLAGGVSFLPGGLGTTEAVMTGFLVARGLHLPDAMLATLLCRLLTLWFAVVLGWLAVFGLRRRAEMVPRCP